MTDQPGDFITFYSSIEGGDLLPYSGIYQCVPDDSFLQHAQGNVDSDGTVLIFGIHMYSFRTQLGCRWDCRDGWTNTVERSNTLTPEDLEPQPAPLELSKGVLTVGNSAPPTIKDSPADLSPAAVFDPDSVSGS